MHNVCSSMTFSLLQSVCELPQSREERGTGDYYKIEMKQYKNITIIVTKIVKVITIITVLLKGSEIVQKVLIHINLWLLLLLMLLLVLLLFIFCVSLTHTSLICAKISSLHTFQARRVQVMLV